MSCYYLVRVQVRDDDSSSLFSHSLRREQYKMSLQLRCSILLPFFLHGALFAFPAFLNLGNFSRSWIPSRAFSVNNMNHVLTIWKKGEKVMTRRSYGMSRLRFVTVAASACFLLWNLVQSGVSLNSVPRCRSIITHMITGLVQRPIN